LTSIHSLSFKPRLELRYFTQVYPQHQTRLKILTLKRVNKRQKSVFITIGVENRNGLKMFSSGVYRSDRRLPKFPAILLKIQSKLNEKPGAKTRI
jgi:hypothetical protein